MVGTVSEKLRTSEVTVSAMRVGGYRVRNDHHRLVGLILWGSDLELSGLEVYDMDAGDGGVRLPVPSSVRDWGT